MPELPDRMYADFFLEISTEKLIKKMRALEFNLKNKSQKFI